MQYHLRQGYIKLIAGNCSDSEGTHIFTVRLLHIHSTFSSLSGHNVTWHRCAERSASQTPAFNFNESHLLQAAHLRRWTLEPSAEEHLLRPDCYLSHLNPKSHSAYTPAHGAELQDSPKTVGILQVSLFDSLQSFLLSSLHKRSINMKVEDFPKDLRFYGMKTDLRAGLLVGHTIP